MVVIKTKQFYHFCGSRELLFLLKYVEREIETSFHSNEEEEMAKKISNYLKMLFVHQMKIDLFSPEGNRLKGGRFLYYWMFFNSNWCHNAIIIKLFLTRTFLLINMRISHRSYLTKILNEWNMLSLILNLKRSDKLDSEANS